MRWIRLLGREKGRKMEWDRGGIKEGWLEGLGVEGVGGRTGVCFRMVLDL